jgi:membrane-associated protease RseP (regulator of RpoE activity)
MDTTHLILLILLIIYVPFYFYVRRNPAMADKGIVTYGPFVMFKTQRGIRHLDKLAKYKRFWKVFGTISKILAFFLMAMILFIIVIDLMLLPLMMESPGIGVEYALAIPGINPMLPIWYGLLGLIVAVVIHEIAHGIQTRANDMAVESTGLLYAVVPVGAFVEPNDEEIKKAGRKARSDMFAAGIAVNFVVAVVFFIIMSFGLMGSLSSDFGDRAAVTNVYAGSPADDAGIGFSSVILRVDDGTGPIEMTYDVLTAYDFYPGTLYTVTYLTSHGPDYVDMYMGVYIFGVAKGSPAAAAGIPKNSFIVSIGGYDVTNVDSFRDALAEYSPGDPVLVEYKTYDHGTLTDGSETVTLGENNGKTYLGVNYCLSGFAFTTPDAVLAGAKNPFSNIDSVFDVPYAAMSYIGAPFRGHSPIPAELQWWYHSSVMSDGAFWVAAQAMFWIFWLNLVLAVTNALPAVPFDGGYLLRDGVGALVDRRYKQAPQERKDKITDTTTRIISYLMLISLMVIMITILF